MVMSHVCEFLPPWRVRAQRVAHRRSAGGPPAQVVVLADDYMPRMKRFIARTGFALLACYCVGRAGVLGLRRVLPRAARTAFVGNHVIVRFVGRYFYC